VPLIDVTHDDSVSDGVLRELARSLPAIVAEAVDCPEEPWIGPPAAGDIEIRFHAKGSFDVGELSCVIEVRTKTFPSRAADSQRRADLIRDRVLAEAAVGSLGVWLVLAEGSWSQSG
jgi:hypothetical protein